MMVRSCKGCRARRPVQELLRLHCVGSAVFASPALDGRAGALRAGQRRAVAQALCAERVGASADVGLPGRGVVTCPRRRCVESTLRNRRLGLPLGADAGALLLQAAEVTRRWAGARRAGLQRRRLDLGADARLLSMQALIQRLSDDAEGRHGASVSTLPRRGERETRP